MYGNYMYIGQGGCKSKLFKERDVYTPGIFADENMNCHQFGSLWDTKALWTNPSGLLYFYIWYGLGLREEYSFHWGNLYNYGDVIMSAMASQITSLLIVYSTVYSSADQRKDQSSASLAFVLRIHQWPVNSRHKGPVTRKQFLFDYIIMRILHGHTDIIPTTMNIKSITRNSKLQMWEEINIYTDEIRNGNRVQVQYCLQLF